MSSLCTFVRTSAWGHPGVLVSTMIALSTALNCDPCIQRGSYKIKTILHGNSSEYFSKQLQSAAEQSGSDMGVNFGIEFHSDDRTMAKSIENFIGSTDALVVSVPSETVQRAVEKAINKDIPIFVANAGHQISEETGILDFVGMDQEEGGREAAKELLNIRNNSIDKALFINHKGGYPPFDRRKDGFLSELNVSSGGASVDELYDISVDSIAAALDDCPYDAVLIASETVLDVVLQASKCDQNVHPIATFGSSKNVFDAIAQRKLAFSIAEQSFLQGALPVLLASLYATTGQRIVPPSTQTHIYKSGPKIINLENLHHNTPPTHETDGFPICPPDTQGGTGCTDRSRIEIGGVLHGVTKDVFWDPVFAASKQAAEDMGIELLLDRFEHLEDQNLLHQKMATKIESLCKQNIDGLFVTIPSRDLVDALKTCQKLHVPVISVNTGIEVSRDLGLVHHVGMLDFDAGFEAGERLVRMGMRRGLCLIHSPGNTALLDRCNGFEDAISRANAAGNNIEYLGQVDVPLNDTARYGQVVEAAVNEEGDWYGVGLFLLGPVQVEEALLVQENHTNLIMGSVDTSDAIYGAIDEGKILFGIEQGPYMQGYMPVALLTWLSYTKQSLMNGVIHSGPNFVERSPSKALQVCEANLFTLCEPGGGISTAGLIALLVATFGVLFIAVGCMAFSMRRVKKI